MSDWLSDLRKTKQRAIETQKNRVLQEKREEQTRLKELRAGQDTITSILRETQIEKLLLQLAHEVVAGHPGFQYASLSRRVDYYIREDIPPQNKYEHEPYKSGYLWWASPPRHRTLSDKQVTPLPRDLPTRDGYFLTLVSWDLILYESGDYEYFLHANVTANGLAINAESVHPHTLENVQMCLAKGFENPGRMDTRARF
jgi:hypothetical protein